MIGRTGDQDAPFRFRGGLALRLPLCGCKAQRFVAGSTKAFTDAAGAVGRMMHARQNLFRYPTTEFSQDTIVCWSFDWASQRTKE